MDAYAGQIEAGKNIIREVLDKLATDLKQPKIKDFQFRSSDKDFDNDQESILDDQLKVVTKVNVDDLADAPATPTTRRNLEAQLKAAVKAHYKM